MLQRRAEALILWSLAAMLPDSKTWGSTSLHSAIVALYWRGPHNAGDISVKLAKLAFDQLLANLHDPDYRTRWMAARDLGKLGDPRAVEPLLEALRDKT